MKLNEISQNRNNSTTFLDVLQRKVDYYYYYTGQPDRATAAAIVCEAWKNGF